jgi:hypothetical protein
MRAVSASVTELSRKKLDKYCADPGGAKTSPKRDSRQRANNAGRKKLTDMTDYKTTTLQYIKRER